MLHIRCGDDILPKLKEAGLPGEFMRWADPLCQGPTPRGLTLKAWRAARTRFAVDHYRVTLKQAHDFLDSQGKKLGQYRRHEEIVLWFEHDLFDQTILVYLLDWFSHQPEVPQKISLICIGKFPGKKRFIGLGHLSARELASLFPERREVTADQLRLAKRAWDAWTHPTPRALEGLGKGDTSALPFLHHAILRHWEELPSTVNGLSLTEQWVMEAVIGGASDPASIFKAVQEREKHPWCGDTMLWWYVDELIEGNAPLLEVVKGAWCQNGQVDPVTFQATSIGMAVVCGKKDWLSLKPIDRWVGGLHLRGSKVWRWNPFRRRVVRAGPSHEPRQRRAAPRLPPSP